MAVARILWAGDMRRQMTLLVLSGVLFAGCAKVLFTRDGATAQDFERDKWACDRDLGMLGTGTASSEQRLAYAMSRYRADLEQCLTLKGWRRIP